MPECTLRGETLCTQVCHGVPEIESLTGARKQIKDTHTPEESVTAGATATTITECAESLCKTLCSGQQEAVCHEVLRDPELLQSIGDIIDVASV